MSDIIKPDEAKSQAQPGPEVPGQVGETVGAEELRQHFGLPSVIPPPENRDPYDKQSDKEEAQAAPVTAPEAPAQELNPDDANGNGSGQASGTLTREASPIPLPPPEILRPSAEKAPNKPLYKRLGTWVIVGVGVAVAAGAALLLGPKDKDEQPVGGPEVPELPADGPTPTTEARPTTTIDQPAPTTPNTIPNSGNQTGEIVMAPSLTVDGVTIERLAQETDFIALFTSSDKPEDVIKSYELVREYTFNYGKTFDDHLGGGSAADPSLWIVPFKILYTNYEEEFGPELRSEWEQVIDDSTSRRNTIDPDYYRDTVVPEFAVKHISDTEMEITARLYEQSFYLGELVMGAEEIIVFRFVKEVPPEVAGYSTDTPIWRVADTHFA